jgi:hypothetical protein
VIFHWYLSLSQSRVILVLWSLSPIHGSPYHSNVYPNYTVMFNDDQLGARCHEYWDLCNDMFDRIYANDILFNSNPTHPSWIA